MTTTYPPTYSDLPRVAPVIEPETPCATPRCNGRAAYLVRYNYTSSPIIGVCPKCAEIITQNQHHK